jgi:DNA-binding MarR family transcriptional regulator
MARAMKSRDFTKPPSGGIAARGARAEPGLPPLIGALLRVPLDVVRRRILERLHDDGFTDLDEPHLRVLQYPGPQGWRPSDLTAHSRASKQAINHLLNQIERFGYIERKNNPEDARSKHIVLTRRGEAARQTIRAAVAEVEGEFQQTLGARDFATIKRLLRKLYDSLSQ